MSNADFAKMLTFGVVFVGLPVLITAAFLLWALGDILLGAHPCHWLP